MNDWEEIKRLASDLQKAQLSSTLQRLSERNCVEIVTHLIQKKLLNVLFTTDGKEYITPEYLTKEIRSELYLHEGRINLVELSKNLNVDLSQINLYANELQKDKDIQLVLGQLIDDSYIKKVAEEINNKLLVNGKVLVSDLALEYDLPSDFIQKQIIERNLNQIIFAKCDSTDSKLYYTEAYILRTKAKIRGALVALTRPTPIAAILNHCGLSENTFYTLFEQVSPAGVLTSKHTSGQYIPHVYAKSQANWVNNFYRQNQFLEYTNLTRLGINDVRNYIKRLLLNENLTFLTNYAISHHFIDQIEGSLDECLSSQTYIDIESILPSNFDVDDINQLINIVLTPDKQRLITRFDYFIISNAYIDNLFKLGEELCVKRAKEVIENGTYQKFLADKQLQLRGQTENNNELITKTDRREERRKKATSGKTGGGAQGRETKTKSTKKFQRGGNKSVNLDSDDDNDNNRTSKKDVLCLNLISLDDVVKLIENQLENDGISELVDDLSKCLQEKLNTKALDLAAAYHLDTTANDAQKRRQIHSVLQEKLNALINDIRHFDKGIKVLPSNVQDQFTKYLLKTLCTDITNEILFYLNNENELNLQFLSNANQPLNLTYEQRLKVAGECSPKYREQLTNLIKCQNIDDFLSLVECALDCCSMILKKIDKKKDKLLIMNHQKSLMDQLNQCDDPALFLHLAVMILFICFTQKMIYASGKHVSMLISFLQSYLTDQENECILNFYDLVMKSLSKANEASEVINELQEKIGSLKEIVVKYVEQTSLT